MHVAAEFEVSHHERSHVVARATSRHRDVLVLVSSRRRRSILPSFRSSRSRDINLSAGGLACRTTPRRDETNWEIMPLNAAVRPDPITLVFSNTSPSAVRARPFLSFYFTYRAARSHIGHPPPSRDLPVSIIQTILTDMPARRRRVKHVSIDTDASTVTGSVALQHQS